MRKFFVHIIESPSAKDLLNSQLEGRLLIEGLRSAGIASYYNLAVNKTTFMESIGRRFSAAIKEFGIPFLHISAHGNKNGIELTDETFFNWSVLKNILLPINRILNGNLFLNISSCSGFFGCKMAMGLDKEMPFFGLVGPTGEIDYADITIAFVAFYHNFAKGATGLDALEAMKKASGNNKFDIILATGAKKIWIDEVNKIAYQQMMQILLKNPSSIFK